MSLLGLDHVVVMVPDLAAAVRDYMELGFTVVPGGSHPTGTHNALIAFADAAYIDGSPKPSFLAPSLGKSTFP